jgi:hypothetical protein
VRKQCKKANLDWHLVDMNALLNAKIRHHDIKGLVQDADNLSWSNDGTILKRQSVYQGAKEKMLRRLGGQLASFLLGVALLRNLANSFGIQTELRLGS